MENKRKQIAVWLEPESQELLSEFQGNYLVDTKKRISQSEVVNNALKVYIASVYRVWNKIKEDRKDGK